RNNQEELARLTIQDRMITASMGGVLPEQADPSIFLRVLDVACGTGGWAIEVAQQYPSMSVFGIDISGRMIDYARTQAETAGVTDRVEFAIMDALLMLEFPPAHFDLVNMRCSGSFMRTWDWPKMLSEMQRVTRRGGVVRLTEPEILHQSTSPAHMRLFEMFQCAMYRAGHLFTEHTRGIIDHLPGLLIQHGYKQVQTKEYTLEYRAGTPEGEDYYKDEAYAFRTIRPFLQKWGCLSKDYDAIYQQALEEMQQSTFHATWNLRCAWGINAQTYRIPRRD
ncbi:MAG: methyltransferase domain-containing protein, partial [Chloroflexi bacterium]|nr:methyltransferase domain-containing protein [Chloroflexota bacterium]